MQRLKNLEEYLLAIESSVSNLPVTCEGRMKTLPDMSRQKFQFLWTTSLEITEAWAPPKWKMKQNKTENMNIRNMSSDRGERCWKSLDDEEGEAQSDSCAPGVGSKSRSCQTSLKLKSVTGSVSSATFCWLKPVTRPPQIQFRAGGILRVWILGHRVPWKFSLKINYHEEPK